MCIRVSGDAGSYEVISAKPSITAEPTGRRAWPLNRLQFGARIAFLGMSLLVAVGETSAGEFLVEQPPRQDDSEAEHESRSPEDVTPPRRSAGAAGGEGREADTLRGNAGPANSAESTQRAQTPRSPSARESGPDRLGKDREPRGEQINRAVQRY